MVIEKCIQIDDKKLLLEICGVNDKNLRRIELISNCKIYSQGHEIYIEGKNNEIVEKIINNLVLITKNGGTIYKNVIDLMYKEIEKDNNIDISELLSIKIEITKSKKVFNPRTINQGIFLKLLEEKDLVFAYGPAGTGKTFLAIAYAVRELLNKNVKKVILTRPVVEAGESLGFLPGDFIQKLNPYLVPLFDAINFILGSELAEKLSEQNMIEIAPLAYMRGRTFSNAIVILDEAQNTTNNQMKLFLTRPDEKSRLIITGDITQIDLPKNKKSGMVHAIEILKNIDEIGFIEFAEDDVVRHPLVKKIIKAYSSNENI